MPDSGARSYVRAGPRRIVRRMVEPEAEQTIQISRAEAMNVVGMVRPYSMVADEAILFAMKAVLDAIAGNVVGQVVECGTWRGGTSMAMMLAQKTFLGRVRRPVHMLDSFEGLPPVEERDGRLARLYQERKLDPAWYHDNCRVGLDEVMTGLRQVGLQEGEFVVRKGWFDATVPALARDLEGERICVLRLDGDWYKSTAICLEHLVPLVSPGGTVIVDDYYDWDGCARATHDYLSRTDQPFRIRQIGPGLGAYFVKPAE